MKIGFVFGFELGLGFIIFFLSFYDFGVVLCYVYMYFGWFLINNIEMISNLYQGEFVLFWGDLWCLVGWLFEDDYCFFKFDGL